MENLNNSKINSKLSDFLEWEKIYHIKGEVFYKTPFSVKNINIKDMKFHHSWDWMLLGVDKLKKLKIDDINYKSKIASIDYNLKSLKFNIIFLELIIAIDWYNNKFSKEEFLESQADSYVNISKDY